MIQVQPKKKKKENSFDQICKGLFLGLSTVFHWPLCLFASTILFDHWSFVVSVEIMKCVSSSFVLSQDCFIWSLFRFYTNLKIICSGFVKNVICFLIGIELNL